MDIFYTMRFLKFLAIYLLLLNNTSDASISERTFKQTTVYGDGVTNFKTETWPRYNSTMIDMGSLKIKFTSPISEFDIVYLYIQVLRLSVPDFASPPITAMHLTGQTSNARCCRLLALHSTLVQGRV